MNESTLLSTATARHIERSALDLLTELSEVHGITISDIASALRVRVPTIRIWRKDRKTITPGDHLRLATLLAFLEILTQAVATPVRWISEPLVDGFNVTPLDIYSPDRAAQLLALAVGNGPHTAESLLDTVDTEWRGRWKSDYEVFEALDGEYSMRPRHQLVPNQCVHQSPWNVRPTQTRRFDR